MGCAQVDRLISLLFSESPAELTVQRMCVCVCKDTQQSEDVLAESHLA